MPVLCAVILGVYLGGLLLFATYVAAKVLVVKYALSKAEELGLNTELDIAPRPDRGQYL